MEFINSEWDYDWFPSAYIYFGRGGGKKKEKEGKKEGKEEREEEKEGVEGKAGEVLREGKEDEGEDKEEGKRGWEENKGNIFIIIILRGRLTF